MTLITPSTVAFLADIGRSLGAAWQQTLMREIGRGTLVDMGKGEWPKAQVKPEPLQNIPEQLRLEG